MDINNIREEIYYIEDKQNIILAHTIDKVYEISGNLIDIKDKLPNNFYYINPNVIVNESKVSEYNFIDCYITLDNGVKIDKIIKKFNIC